MTRETQIISVETDLGWALKVFELAPASAPKLYRVELSNPEGRLVFVKSLVAGIDDGLGAVRKFLAGERIEHTGVVLAELVRAEVKFSNAQEETS